MIEVLREHVIHMLHTHDGSRVAMMCLWHGTAKVGGVLSHRCGGQCKINVNMDLSVYQTCGL